MVIKTKKYQLKPGTYIKIAMRNVMKQYWWVWLIPLVTLLIPVFYLPAVGWCVGIAITLSVLYALFWLIQFAGFTQMEQSKIFFDRLSYEIDSQKILIKINTKQAMPMDWSMVKQVNKKSSYFLLIISKAQFIYLPHEIFKNEREIKRVDMILKRKNFIK